MDQYSVNHFTFLTMTEIQLQAKCYTDIFYNTYPELRGMIFKVKNETTSNQRGSGLYPGVADLCGASLYGTFLAFEFKIPGSSHEVKRLRSQLEWRDTIVKRGGFHAFIFDVEQWKKIIVNIFEKNDLDMDYNYIEYPWQVVWEAAKAKTKKVKLNYK